MSRASDVRSPARDIPQTHGERAKQVAEIKEDVKALVKVIQLGQEGRQDEVGKMLDELWGVDREVAIQWHKVMSSIRT